MQPGESVVYAFSANELVHISSVAFIINQERKITDCVISDLVQSDEGDWSGMVTCLVPADAPE